MLSIIVTAYNQKENIKKIIQQVQQLQHVNELIIVDDGSVDGLNLDMPSIIDQNNTDVDIHYIYQQNGGVSVARNKGLDNISASTRYVTFIDGDDGIFPDQYNALIQNELVANSPQQNEQIYFEYLMSTSYSPNQPVQLVEKPLPSYGLMNIHDVFVSLYENIFTHSIFNKIYSYQIFEEHGVRFDEGVDIGEDVRFNIKYSYFVDQVKLVHYQCYNYDNNLIFSQSLSKRFDPCFFEYAMSEIKLIADFCDRKNIVYPTLNSRYLSQLNIWVNKISGSSLSFLKKKQILKRDISVFQEAFKGTPLSVLTKKQLLFYTMYQTLSPAIIVSLSLLKTKWMHFRRIA